MEENRDDHHLDGAQFLLQKVLYLLQHRIIVQATVEHPSDEHVGPDHIDGGAEEQRLVDPLPQIVFLSLPSRLGKVESKSGFAR